MRKIAWLLWLVLSLAPPCLAQESVHNPPLSLMQLLDATADFSFAIMSDHKGSAPSNRVEMGRMVQWIDESRDRFVIGLGDHLCKRFENPFLDFLAENRWWHRKFYPNIADGENEYYGEGQGDWGAGGKLLDAVAIASRPGVKARDSGCEYYARLFAKGFAIHLIQLHYSDNPPDTAIAFNEDTRRFLVDTLESINKGPEDIIIACAHSRTGFWVHELSPERQRIVMDKCDLVLSATTHRYGRQVIPGYETRGALCINTGSVDYAGNNGGYLQVHVFAPARVMLLQYVSTQAADRVPSLPLNRAYLKEIGGTIYEVDMWADPTPAPRGTE